MKTFFLSTLIAVFFLFFTNGIQAQNAHGQKDISFPNCLNYKDSCIYIGNVLVQKISDKKFEDLESIFSDTILFRALTPPSIITSNNPTEVANTLKKWFNADEPDQCKIIDSKSEFFVDCLHVYYRVFRTYKGNSYEVEQQLYCEVSSGRIQKLSLVCSGFRKVINAVESSVRQDVKNIESAKELNQVELHKQYIGNWKSEMGKDTTVFWNGKPYGTGLECYFKLVAKGKIVIEGKQIWAYDRKADKFILSELNKGVDNGIYPSYFVSENKCKMLPIGDIINPENAQLKWEDEFKSPDLFLHKTIVNNIIVKTDTYTRVK